MSKKKVDLRDFGNAGSWPLGWQLGLCSVLAAVILFLIYWVWIRDQRETLGGLEHTELSLRSDFTTKQGRAANLQPLIIQLAQMQDMLQQMLRQLPGKTEMPDLIVDISQTALATGINNELFQPGPEEPKEFYAEKPINLRMVGTYHQFGAFMSGVASLPRVVILTMHNISLKPTDKGGEIGANGSLTLEGTVRTYRYLDEDETAAADAAAAKTDGAAKPAPAPTGAK